jgi:hypothetical protein
MRMLVTVEFADAGVKTGTHRVLVIGGCSDLAAPGDIGMSLDEAKTHLSALQSIVHHWRHRAGRKPPEIVFIHLMEGIGLALDPKHGRRFITDFGGNVDSVNLDGSSRKTLLFWRTRLHHRVRENAIKIGKQIEQFRHCSLRRCGYRFVTPTKGVQQ